MGKDSDLFGSMGKMDALQNLAAAGTEQSNREFLSIVTNYLAKATATLTNPQVLSALLEADKRNSVNVFENASVSGIPLKGVGLNTLRSSDINDIIGGLGQQFHEDAKKYNYYYTRGPEFAIIRNNSIGMIVFTLPGYDLSSIPSYSGPSSQGQDRIKSEATSVYATIKTLGGNWQRGLEKSGKYMERWFRQITPQDFVRYPDIFPRFVQAVDARVAQATRLINPQRAAVLDVLKQNIATAEQAAKEGRLTNQDLGRLAQEIAQGAILVDPVLQNAKQQGLSEQQVKTIVATVVEERLAGYQVAENRRIAAVASAEVQKQIQQIAGNDKQAQEKLKKAVRGFRDPERVLRAALSIVRGFVPGAEGVAAVIEAADDLFGPPQR